MIDWLRHASWWLPACLASLMLNGYLAYYCIVWVRREDERHLEADRWWKLCMEAERQVHRLRLKVLKLGGSYDDA